MLRVKSPLLAIFLYFGFHLYVTEYLAYGVVELFVICTWTGATVWVICSFSRYALCYPPKDTRSSSTLDQFRPPGVDDFLPPNALVQGQV